MNKPEFILLSKDELEQIIQASAIKAVGLIPTPALQIQTEVDEYITRIEAAKRLKISLPTLWKLTKFGHINAYKIGKKVLYKPADIHNLTRKMVFKAKSL